MSVAALKPSARINEVLTEAVRAKLAPAKTAAVAETENAAPIKNPFYAVMFDESLSPEAKRDAFRSLATFTGSKEDSRERIKEYATFEEYLQTVRERMATEIIRLQDTETFSVLQTVMNNLNGQLVDFENQMQPLTDITDAIYTLRTNDATLDVFREIQDDKHAEEKRKFEESERERRFADVQATIANAQDRSAQLGEQKSFFGFGPVTEAARREIARNTLDIERSKAELDRLHQDIAAADASAEKAPGKFEAEKAKLRELLDLTSDQHKERQKALVASALHFVESAKRDIGEVKVHLEKMSWQVENLLDNNTKMIGVYAIMSEGIEDAQKDNLSIRQTIAVAPSDERSIGKMQREEKKMVLDDHIRLLDDAIRTTSSAAADLTSQTIRVKGMKDANEETLSTTRNLHTQGVASIADRLSSTLQAVSSAALGESSAAAKDTLRKMAASTDKVSQRESIRVAMGIKDRNSDLIAAIDSLGAYGEVQRAANDITRSGISEIRENLDRLKALATGVQGDLHDSFAAVADATTPTAAPVPPKANGVTQPFSIGGLA